MICPVCKSSMIIVEHENIELDYCTNCKGVWFDSGELELLLESAGLEDGLPRLAAGIAAENNSTEKKQRCPICHQKMKKGFIDEGGEILIDICQNEDGIWFDGGEIGHLLKLLTAKSGGKAGSPQRVMDFLTEVFKSQT